MDLQQLRDLPRVAADIPTQVYRPPASADGKPTPANCVVCLQAIAYESATKEFVCRHVCHAGCADRWLQSELHCPACKSQVLSPVTVLPPIYVGQAGEYATPQAVPYAVPVNGMNAHMYGICRDCHQSFYRDPQTVRPETNAWYRCANCRSDDGINIIRGSCSVQ